MKNLGAIVLFSFLTIIVSGCGSSTSTYSENKRQELTKASKLVLTASFRRHSKLTPKSLIDFVEGRKGFSNRMEYAVFFKVREFLKGDYGKEEFSIGVNMPGMAFGMKPGEYSGQKIYTLYFSYDEKLKRDVLIGAEWQPVKY